MADEFIVVGSPLPRIAGAAAQDRRFAEITWADGSVQVIDLAPALSSHRAFIRLRSDDRLFRTLKVSEFGDSVVWDDGSELSAVWVRDLADSGLENAEFRDAMDKLSMSLDGMAARLGIARRLVADYRKDKPIPKTVALAVKYLVEHQRKTG